MSAVEAIVDRWFQAWGKVDGGSKADLVLRLEGVCFDPTHIGKGLCIDPAHEDVARVNRALNTALDALWVALKDGKLDKGLAERLQDDLRWRSPPT